MQKMSNEEYGRYVMRLSPKSALAADCIKAFLIGGLICAAGQAISDFYGGVLRMDRDTAGAMTSITLIFLSALLTALNVYDDIAKHGGAGTLVPITGFANAVVAPAMEYKSEGFITGMAVMLFTVAGPVLVYGISASVVYGLILCVLP